MATVCAVSRQRGWCRYYANAIIRHGASHGTERHDKTTGTARRWGLLRSSAATGILWSAPQIVHTWRLPTLCRLLPVRAPPVIDVDYSAPAGVCFGAVRIDAPQRASTSTPVLDKPTPTGWPHSLRYLLILMAQALVSAEQGSQPTSARMIPEQDTATAGQRLRTRGWASVAEGRVIGNQALLNDQQVDTVPIEEIAPASQGSPCRCMDGAGSPAGV